MFHKIMGNLEKNAGNRGHNIIFFPLLFQLSHSKEHKNRTGGKYMIFLPILFGSFQYLFSLKTIIYTILSSAMLCENHAVLGGKNIDIQGGGEISVFNQNIDP
jgi:hypothetical protein